MLNFLKTLFSKRQEDSPRPPEVDEAKLETLRRIAWVPRVEDGDGPLQTSKFSGAAAVREGEGWPLCQNCGKPLQLFVQLNTEELPSDARLPWSSALIQVFYCTSSEPLCEVDCEAWDAFAKSTLLRVLPLAEAVSHGNPASDAFAAKRIVGWDPAEDYPGWEELQEAGFSEAAIEDISNRGFPLQGEKLGGWPYWVQSVEYPDCPRCQARMAFAFQIDSECNLPYMFGDTGCGHVTYCERHPDVLAFRWACH